MAYFDCLRDLRVAIGCYQCQRDSVDSRCDIGMLDNYPCGICPVPEGPEVCLDRVVSVVAYGVSCVEDYRLADQWPGWVKTEERVDVEHHELRKGVRLSVVVCDSKCSFPLGWLAWIVVVD